MKSLKSPKKAFTLVEILMVLALIAILGSILISSDYKSSQIRNSLLTDAEAVAAELRDMQNRTTNFVKSSNVDNVGHGVYVDISNPSKVESFYKINTQDFSSIEVPTISSIKPSDDIIFNNGDRVNRICLNSCDNTTNKIAIYFIKPKAYIYFFRSEDGLSFYNTTSSNDPINHICIEIKPMVGDDVRKVDVYYIGQIAFSSGVCE